MKLGNKLLVFICIMFSGWQISLHASESANPQSSKRCVPLAQIDGITIIDDKNIVFRTPGNKQFLNRLPHSCPNLDKRKAIMYKTPLNQLCNMDIITVLDPVGGGFISMGACGLGDFQPISEAEFKDLKESMKDK